MKETVKHFYHQLRYWRQLRKGFGLLSYHDKQDFVLVNSRAFIFNGVDPLVKVDLTSGDVEQYKPPKDTAFSIYYKVKNSEEENVS